MFVIPNSSAMDATAYGGGPSTFVSRIATGSPERIAQLVEQRLKQAEQFLKLIEQARSAVQTLDKAWSGQAGETAVKKFTDTLESFEKIVKVIEASSQLLGVSGTLVKAAQTAYTSVVSAVNPVVASLASNWWTYWAAVSLSTSASAGLRAFIEGVEALLNALGGSQLMQEITTLVQIVQDVEKLIGSGSHGTAVPPAGTYAKPSTGGLSQNALHAPPQIASTTGQQVAANGGYDASVAATLGQYAHPNTSARADGTYPTGTSASTDPYNNAAAQIPYTGGTSAASQYPNTAIPTTAIPNPAYPNTTFPTTAFPTAAQPTAGQPAADTSGFIPVDPPLRGADIPVTAQPISTPAAPAAPVTPVASAPAAPAVPPAHAATPPGDITVTTTYDGVSTTVTMPVGTQTDVTLVDPTNGSTVTEHIMASAS
ncbi:hypothetical protein GCM10009839_49150 [Catenulispora yoronensis]|uniref:WXG100 family type VII secretion target n=1 Tax=Catenulispora yoronensis TaxID=450799 RepID=A0ABP5G811_9ACTN